MKIFIPNNFQELLKVRVLYKERAEWLRERGIPQWEDVDTRYSAERLMQLALQEVLYALEHNGQIIAAGCLFKKDKMWEDVPCVQGKKVLFIHGLVSKQGLENNTMAKPGKMFLKMVEAKALLGDYSHIALDCRKENERLNDYYESFGFVERITKNYSSTGEIASLKAKYIRGE